MFFVYVEEEAKANLKKLDVKDFNLCNSALSSLSVNPFPGIGGDKEKLKGYDNRYRIHISRKYTAIYKIDTDKKKEFVFHFSAE